MRRRRLGGPACALILCVVYFGACVGAEPIIVDARHALVYQFDGSGNYQYETLNFFVHVSDDDGFADIAELYLINDDYSIYWQATERTWDTVTRNGVMWIGAEGFRLSDEPIIPRGEYRVQVYDQAGESDGVLVTISEHLPVNAVGYSAPLLQYNSDTRSLYLESVFTDNEIRWYISENEEPYRYQGAGGAINFNGIDDAGELQQNIPISQFYVYAFNEDLENAYFSVGPIRF